MKRPKDESEKSAFLGYLRTSSLENALRLAAIKRTTFDLWWKSDEKFRSDVQAMLHGQDDPAKGAPE